MAGLRLYAADPTGYAGADTPEISQDGTQTNPDTDIYNSDLAFDENFKQLWLGVERCRLAVNLAATAGPDPVTLSLPRFENGDLIILHDESNGNLEIVEVASGGGTINLTVNRPGPNLAFLAASTAIYIHLQYTSVSVEVVDTYPAGPNINVAAPPSFGTGDETATLPAGRPAGLPNYPVYQLADDGIGTNPAKTKNFAGPLKRGTNATFWRWGRIPQNYAEGFTGNKIDIAFNVAATEAPIP